MSARVTAFFDQPTNTVTYLVSDPASGATAIIDSLLDFDLASGRTSTASADKLLAYVEQESLHVIWILETHAHADHLSAAPYLKRKTAGKYGIGRHITEVQSAFKEVFNFADGLIADGSQFDQLFGDGDQLALGELNIRVMHTPGHTPACITYVIGDAAFVGDTLFMPDYGTARVDFPGGDASTLYRSIQKIFELPGATRIFTCHDYKAPGRETYAWQSSVSEQRETNIHVHEGVSELEYVKFRNQRDATLAMPKLILPSIQVNIQAGQLPAPESNGITYLKIPLNVL